jgi:4-amino-4-deoxy-L-arabinose transferase-like glycosyltransferase
MRTRSFPLRRAALVALAIGVVLCFAGVFQQGLWAPDEPREAEIGREMLLSRWSAVPTLNGAPFLEKPPLFVWIMAAAYRLFGVSPGVARLPAALFGVGTVFVAYLAGRRSGGRAAGLCAAAVLATCNEFASTSHSAVNDTALTFFVAAGHYAFLVARDDRRLGRRSNALVFVGVCAALAFLTKGLVGPVLVAGPPILAAAALREWAFARHALAGATLWCGVFLAALGLPWVLALARSAGWDAVNECLWRNTIGRTLGASGGEAAFGVHEQSAWYYLKAFPECLLPWIVAVPALVAGETVAPTWRAGRSRYLAVVVLAGVVLLSIPAGKRTVYAMPLVPAAATVFGVWLSRAGSKRGGRWDRATLVLLLAAAAFVAGFAAYAFAGGRIPASSAMKERVDALLAYHGSTMTLVAVGAAAVAAATAWLAVLAVRRPVACAVRCVVVAAVACAFLVHAVGRSLLDRPLEDLGPGARELADAVPADEEMLAVAPDEVLRAVVPFYTGRFVRSGTKGVKAVDRLGPSPWRYLIVSAPAESLVDDTTRSRLRFVRTVSLNFARTVNVYRIP